MYRRTLIALAAISASLASPLALSQSGEIKIAHIYSKTGPLEAYGKQTAVGFMMGLDYATGGTMMVAGKKLVVIEKDDQASPTSASRCWPPLIRTTRPTWLSARRLLVWRWPCCQSPKNTKRSCWSSLPWRTPSPATNGINTSSARAATAARTRSPTPWRWTRPA